MPGVSVSGNALISKETVTKQVKSSDLKMSSALIVGKIVTHNKIVSKTSQRAIVRLNINQKGVFNVVQPWCLMQQPSHRYLLSLPDSPIGLSLPWTLEQALTSLASLGLFFLCH